MAISQESFNQNLYDLLAGAFACKLKIKLEEKCEQVELLTVEVEKWKSHSQKLDETRLVGIKSLENANGEIRNLKSQVSNLESQLKSKSDKYKMPSLSGSCLSLLRHSFQLGNCFVL